MAAAHFQALLGAVEALDDADLNGDTATYFMKGLGTIATCQPAVAQLDPRFQTALTKCGLHMPQASVCAVRSGCVSHLPCVCGPEMR